MQPIKSQKMLTGKIHKVLILFKIFLQEIFCKCQVIKMSVTFNYNGEIIKANWGDDINYWFFRELTKTPLINYDWSLYTQKLNRPYIMGIGSILTLFPIKNSIIWGSGIISEKAPIKGRPQEVRAVRGPLTRQRLLDQGINCPEVYGDPALLLPFFYKPFIKKKYSLGIIPHYTDQHNPLWKNLYKEIDVLVIDIRCYEHWLDFIDQICQCETIASSSLHGLIVSEAYGIPNLWIKLKGSKLTDDFKYHDFFLSIGRDREAFEIDHPITKNELWTAVQKWKKGNINLAPLLASCPFKLKKNIEITR